MVNTSFAIGFGFVILLLGAACAAGTVYLFVLAIRALRKYLNEQNVSEEVM